jgi:Concanavalin A-like lectin/glucanases superfamily
MAARLSYLNLVGLISGLAHDQQPRRRSFVILLLISCVFPGRLVGAAPKTASGPSVFLTGTASPPVKVQDSSWVFPVTAIGDTSGACFRLCFCNDVNNCTCDASGTETLDHDLSAPFSAFNYQLQPYSGGTFDCKSGTPVTLPVLLSAGQQLTFDVEFSPTGPGTFTDYLTLSGYTISFSGSTPAGGCTSSATTLCIDGRFQVQVSYSTSQGGGQSGSGNAIALSSLGVTEGGLFWFFGASNPEMLIKVIDGCSLNSKYWVFFAATTNVGFTVTVTDTTTGNHATYKNPDRTAALPVQDTSALPCAAGPPEPYGVDANTVALYHFEDPPGNVVADATGVNPGVATGTTIAPSLFGHGRQFRGNGDGDYITVPDNPSLRGVAQMTIEAWVYPTGFDLGADNANETIVGRGDQTPPYNLYQITMTRNNDPASSFYYFTVAMQTLASGQGSSAQSTIHHLPNQWYYIVGTYDGQKARVYVNGVLEQVGNTLPGLVVNTIDPLYFDNHTFFGQTASSNGRIGGVFDEIRISNIARSASEIAAIYAAAPHTGPH